MVQTLAIHPANYGGSVGLFWAKQVQFISSGLSYVCVQAIDLQVPE